MIWAALHIKLGKEHDVSNNHTKKHIVESTQIKIIYVK